MNEAAQRDRHAFRPALDEAALEDRVLPALLPLNQFSNLSSGSSGLSGGGGGGGFGTGLGLTFGTSIFGAGPNAGLGVGFSYRFSSFYALNSGLGLGYGIFSATSNLASLAGSPGINPYRASLGGAAGIQAGPRVGSGGEAGVSPAADPGGPQPAQATPAPSDQPPASPRLAANAPRMTGGGLVTAPATSVPNGVATTSVSGGLGPVATGPASGP